jgi:8-oxo-dGTP pyrophosphatase MutT (NUDIX family)
MAAGIAGTRENPIPRVAARVLLVDGADRLLLLRGFDPAAPDERYWFTVGGGLDNGESFVEAAVRELLEETGLRLRPDELVGPVRREYTDIPFDGRWYRQEQEYFVARVSRWDVSLDGLDAEEVACVDGHRWWSVADLETATEPYYPTDLVHLFSGILEA